VLFQLGRDEPAFRVDDYQLLSDYLEREQLAGSMRGVHADRAVALIYVLSKRRTRLFEVLKVLRFSMLRRQQDARDRDNTGASRNWSEWNQQQSTTP